MPLLIRVVVIQIRILIVRNLFFQRILWRSSRNFLQSKQLWVSLWEIINDFLKIFNRTLYRRWEIVFIIQQERKKSLSKSLMSQISKGWWLKYLRKTVFQNLQILFFRPKSFAAYGGRDKGPQKGPLTLKISSIFMDLHGSFWILELSVA